MEQLVKDLCHACGSMESSSRFTALNKVFSHPTTSDADREVIRRTLLMHCDSAEAIKMIVGPAYVPTEADFLLSLRGCKDVILWTAETIDTMPSFEKIDCALGVHRGLPFKVIQRIPGLTTWQKCQLLIRDSYHALGVSIMEEKLVVNDLTQAQLLLLLAKGFAHVPHNGAVEIIMDLISNENLEKVILDLFVPFDVQMKCLAMLKRRSRMTDGFAQQLFDGLQMSYMTDRDVLAKLSDVCPALISRVDVELVVHDRPDDVCSICHEEVGRLYYGCINGEKQNPHYLCINCGPLFRCPMMCNSSMKMVRFDPKREREEE